MKIGKHEFKCLQIQGNKSTKEEKRNCMVEDL
jgi:hypothetical protein